MKLIERYKAALITGLLTGIVVLALFSIQLKQQGDLITESYYELEPEPELTEQKDKLPEIVDGASTNKVFNEDQEFKNLMKNFKSVSANDFEQTTKALEEAKLNAVTETTEITESYTNDNAYALNTDETDSYKKLQDRLNKRLDNKKFAAEHANKRSNINYSLVGRKVIYPDVPIYLCEDGGKIVVSIRVNDEGQVFDAFINGSSNSKNQCLIDHSIEYAKLFLFDSSPKKEQLGTITFMFKGKN